MISTCRGVPLNDTEVIREQLHSRAGQTFEPLRHLLQRSIGVIDDFADDRVALRKCHAAGPVA